jgi:hypothetical protein
MRNAYRNLVDKIEGQEYSRDVENNYFDVAALIGVLINCV